MDNAVGAFLTQLLQQSPLLLAYVIAIILVLTNWQRCPTPCMLTLAAVVLLLATPFLASPSPG